MAKKKLSDAISNTINKVADNTATVNNLAVYDVKLSDIIENENNFYNTAEDDKFEALIESIRGNGVLEPVIVFKNEDGKTYTLISGHRRKMACEKLGLNTIPARVKIYNDDKDKMLSLIETNMTVRDLSVEDIINTIKEYEKIIDEFGIKISGRKLEWIGKRIGLKFVQVDRYKKLDRLSNELKKLFDDKYITLNTASSYATMSDEEQLRVYMKLQAEIDRAEAEGDEKAKIPESVAKEIKDEVIGKEKDDTKGTGNENVDTVEVEETDTEENGSSGSLDFSALEEDNSSDDNTDAKDNDGFDFSKFDTSEEEKDSVKVASLSSVKKCITELVRLCQVGEFERASEVKLELEKCQKVISETLEHI